MLRFYWALTSAVAASLFLQVDVHAADQTSTKFTDHLVTVESDGKAAPADFTFLTKTSKKWKICALFPNIQDSYWVSFDYGIVDEAEKLGVELTVLDAGGYEYLPKQVNQFDDCLASKADAVVVAPISMGGLDASFQKAKDAGVPAIAFSNSVQATTPVASRIDIASDTKGRLAADFLKKTYGAESHKIIAFPGPPGGGWAEAFLKSFERGLEGSSLQVVGARYAATNVSAQLPVVEDALQAYPDADVIWGNAPNIEAALAVVPGSGRKMSLVAAYESLAMLKALRSGKILGFPADFSVMEARVALQLAVKFLEKESVAGHYQINPIMLDASLIKGLDLTQFLAPDGFRPVFHTN